jgi:2'-5' RNA ligase
MNGSNPHFFLALSLPEPVREVLRKKADQLRQNDPFKQWPDPRDYHITLAFLGAAEPRQIDKVQRKMAAVSTHCESFSVTLDKLGIFGRKDRPRILWAGVSAGQELYDLQRKVHEVCRSVGFKLDRRPYKPHITLAKKWNGEQTLDRSTRNDDLDTVSWQVKEITLYQTHLRRVPKYEPVQSFPLHVENGDNGHAVD